MSKITRVFKSGNSVAVRLPKVLGVAEGTEMRVREEQGRYILEPVNAGKRKFNIDKVAGSARNLRYIRPEDRVFKERPLLWEKLLSRDDRSDPTAKK